MRIRKSILEGPEGCGTPSSSVHVPLKQQVPWGLPTGARRIQKAYLSDQDLTHRAPLSRYQVRTFENQQFMVRNFFRSVGVISGKFGVSFQGFSGQNNWIRWKKDPKARWVWHGGDPIPELHPTSNLPGDRPKTKTPDFPTPVFHVRMSYFHMFLPWHFRELEVWWWAQP